VPADFRAGGVSGKVGLLLSPRSRVSLSAGYQEQDDIDYPGRMMDAEFFETLHLKAGWSFTREAGGDGGLRSFELATYLNDVRHRMDNDDKPTALPDPNRVPSFGVDAETNTTSRVWGGRAAAVLYGGPNLEMELGSDLFASHRDGTRLLKRRDTGVVTSNDVVWPDAWIIDAGLFTRLKRVGDWASVSAAVRADFVTANPGSLDAFYSQYVDGDLGASEFNLSGAFSVSLPLAMNWTVALGVGSVVRTADATERYSSRFHSTKMQVSAEFMGNPQLDPERSTQLDFWVRTDYRHIRGSISSYVRRINDYITIEPTNLPTRMPTNPYPVYRYVNGEADFVGVDGTVELVLTRALMLAGEGAYTRGRDRTLDEPVLGIPPLELGARMRWTCPEARGHYVELGLIWVDRQDRVAVTKGERSTVGHTTWDLKAGWFPAASIELRGGVLNLTDEPFVNHLNARNSFTGEPLPEPGRMFFVEVAYSF
jgi:iron complex outermembrane receptor protein